MCLNVVGLTLGLIGAVGLAVSNLWLFPIQMRKEKTNHERSSAYTNECLVVPHKATSAICIMLIALGFLLQIISAG